MGITLRDSCNFAAYRFAYAFIKQSANDVKTCSLRGCFKTIFHGRPDVHGRQ